MLDTAVGKIFIKRLSHKGYALLEEMASNNYNRQSERSMVRRPTEVHQIVTLSFLASYVEVLKRKINRLEMLTAPFQAFICE